MIDPSFKKDSSGTVEKKHLHEEMEPESSAINKKTIANSHLQTKSNCEIPSNKLQDESFQSSLFIPDETEIIYAKEPIITNKKFVETRNQDTLPFIESAENLYESSDEGSREPALKMPANIFRTDVLFYAKTKKTMKEVNSQKHLNDDEENLGTEMGEKEMQCARAENMNYKKPTFENKKFL
jgi:hypothetical protein